MVSIQHFYVVSLAQQGPAHIKELKRINPANGIAPF